LVGAVSGAGQGHRSHKPGNSRGRVELLSKPMTAGAYASQCLSFGVVGKAYRQRTKVANRIREIRLSGMKTGAWGNVTYGGIVNPPVDNRKGQEGNPQPKGARASDLSKRPRPFLEIFRCSGAPVTRLRPEREIGCSRNGNNKSIRQVGQKQGRPELRPMVVRESEGLIRAEKLGNGWYPEPAEQRRPVLVRAL